MEKNKSYQRLSRIDGLRGLAILGVILIHSQTASTPISNEITHNFINMGKYGVQLFFLISGYILCYVLNRTKYSLSEFFAKRFFRLAPLYYLVIILCFLLGFNNELEATTPAMPLDLKNFLVHISFIHGLFPEYIRSIFGISWSLTPEVVFYVFFPFLFMLSNRWLIGLFFAFLAIAHFKYPIATFIFGGTSEALGIWTGLSPFSNMFLFVFGMLVFRIPEFFESKLYKFFGIIGITLFICSGFGLLGKDVYKVTGMIFSNAYFGFVLVAFPFLVYSMDKVTSMLFDNKFMVYMGRWSYSAFFIHYAILMILKNYHIEFNFMLAMLGVIILTMFLSFLSYNYIEQPGVKLGNFIINKIKSFKPILPESAEPAR